MPTEISWTDETWNPVVGCARVSEGCRHCYAERMAYRLSHMPQTAERYEGLTTKGSGGVRWTGQVRLVPEALEKPLRWRKPRRIFVNSMSDLFHNDVPDEFIDRVFAVMACAQQHTFQILTKRAERLPRYFERVAGGRHIWKAGQQVEMPRGQHKPDPAWPLPNVHLGVSVENQAAADERIPLLLQTPAAVRFISAEPLLGPVVFKQQNPDGYWPPNAERPDEIWLPHKDWPDDFQYWQAKAAGIHHVIVGGESGPGARPCDLAWIRSIVRQCREAGVPVFVKQLGACAFDEVNGIAGARIHVPSEYGRPTTRLKHPKGADPTEWPAGLRVQEMPGGGE